MNISILNNPTNDSVIKKFIERGQYQVPENTLNNAVFDVNHWSNFVADVVKNSLWILWNSFLGVAGNLCILVSVAGVIIYVFGYKKGMLLTGGSTGFYVVLKLVNLAFLGV